MSSPFQEELFPPNFCLTGPSVSLLPPAGFHHLPESFVMVESPSLDPAVTPTRDQIRGSPAAEAQSLNQKTTREVLETAFRKASVTPPLPWEKTPAHQ